MGAVVHIAKTDDGALGLGTGNLDAGVPEGLQHQALRARRHGVDQFVKQGFRRDAAPLGNLLFVQAKLLLEPAHHPEAPRDLDFGVVVLRYGGLVRRNKRRGFQVAWCGGVDSGGCAVGQAGNFRRQATRANHLAGFVRSAGNDRRAFRNSGVQRHLRTDRADDGSSAHQFGQHGRMDRQHLPFPVGLGSPAALFVIERNVANLGRNRVHEFAGKAVVEVAREQQELVGLGPDLGLVLCDPVGLGLSLKKAHGIAHANGAKRRFPPPLELGRDIGSALIEPDHGRTQWFARLVQRNRGGALGRDDHTRHCALGHAGVGPQVLAGLAQGLPEGFGIVFHPARLRRLVAVDRHLRFVNQVAMRVKQQGAHALGAVVDGQQIALAHGVVSSGFAPGNW